jgi:hypothetical protein
MPITTVLVDGNFISFVVGFWIAISVIISPALDGISTWYMHNFPGVDNGFTSSRLAGFRLGACPINIFNGLTELASHGSFAAICPFNIE